MIWLDIWFIKTCVLWVHVLSRCFTSSHKECDVHLINFSFIWNKKDNTLEPFLSIFYIFTIFKIILGLEYFPGHCWLLTVYSTDTNCYSYLLPLNILSLFWVIVPVFWVSCVLLIVLYFDDDIQVSLVNLEFILSKFLS